MFRGGPTRHAAAYWRDQSKEGKEEKRSVINTSSTSGLFGNIGQTNYGAAKTGLATFSIIANAELSRYGVRVNAIAPAALTRLTAPLRPEGSEVLKQDEWDAGDPANISPLIVWLCSPESKDITGRVFLVDGDRISVAEGWHRGPTARNDGMRWDPAKLGEVVPGRLEVLGGLQQRLGGDAADVGAGAAERRLAVGAFRLVDARDLQAELRGADRCDVAARPAADHHHVKGLHISSVSRAGSSSTSLMRSLSDCWLTS